MAKLRQADRKSKQTKYKKKKKTEKKTLHKKARRQIETERERNVTNDHIKVSLPTAVPLPP